MDGKEQKNNMECIIQRENKTEISDTDFNEKINQNQTLNEEREKLEEEQQRQAKNLCQRLGEISPNDDNIIDRTGIINNDTEDLKKYDENHFINFCGYKRKLEKSRPSRIKIKEDKNGEQYVSIQIKPWDLPEYIKDWESKEIADWEEDDKEQKIKNERDELQLQKENDFKFNETFKYKFSFKIPENFLESPTRLVIWQRKFNRKKNSNEKKGPNPILAQRIQKINGKYFFIVRDWTQKKKILWTMIELNDIKGKWVDMEYEIKLSDRKRKFVNRPTRSFLKVKAKIEWGKEIQIYNWKLDIEKTNNLILNPETPHSWYFKFWIYRDNYDYTLTKNLPEAE